ncbi:cytochrome P450 [Desarmillaria tabescens]|uniref:Cytochrome P450 n=1 Tax=Armillaria tabescens TaxID=1929756 RepID=A0AA39KB79_ARMTA|nr:cytochrome P450 [Desarmillaria tabescens]KAK0455623.1 cytochrome P450 [Desarmillaria tabescens]
MALVTDVCLFLIALFLIYKISTNRNSVTTNLRGPPSRSWLFGFTKVIHYSEDVALLYEKWSAEYGSVFSVPGFLGHQKLVICDPKAAAHFYSREAVGYVKTPMTRMFIEIMVGKNLVWVEGDLHRQQRKFLIPAFSNAAIRDLTHVFFDSAHRTSSAWDAILEGSDGTSTIDVQNWMNRISMDSIGIAGFSHDFGAIDGKPQIFDSVDLTSGAAVFALMTIVGSVFPAVLRLPSKRKDDLTAMKRMFTSIADKLLAKAKEHGNEEDKSVLGLLLKSETDEADVHMSRDEVIAQNLLLLAGYETTSISLTWSLIELCKNVDIQSRLRAELVQFGNTDPTWEQLQSSLPYLDAVVHEILRTHPPVLETARVTAEDDILPLATPIVTKSGETINSIFVAKGTHVTASIGMLNRSEELWGPDAKEFNPERWLEDSAPRAKEIKGHRHLLTFANGPRMCLGKVFALTEFKAVLYVIIKNFTFEFPGGKDTVIGKHLGGVLARPKVVGEEGARVPLRMRRV